MVYQNLCYPSNTIVAFHAYLLTDSRFGSYCVLTNNFSDLLYFTYTNFLLSVFICFRKYLNGLFLSLKCMGFGSHLSSSRSLVSAFNLLSDLLLLKHTLK